MAEWLMWKAPSIKYDAVLELGCGVGLVERIASRVLPSTIPFVATDVDSSSRPARKNGCNVVAFDWRQDPLLELPGGLNPSQRLLILAADVIYDVDVTTALFGALRKIAQLCSPYPPTIVISAERRVTWLFGDPAPSSFAYDDFMVRLWGCTAAPINVDAVPHTLPYVRRKELTLWTITRIV